MRLPMNSAPASTMQTACSSGPGKSRISTQPTIRPTTVPSARWPTRLSVAAYWGWLANTTVSTIQ